MMMASGDLAGAMLGRVMSDIDSHGGALLPYSSSTVTVTTSPLGPSQLRLTPPVQTSRGVFPASQSQSSHHSAPPVGNNERKSRCVVIGSKAEVTHCQPVAGTCYSLYRGITKSMVL
ncbi:hypothetical protein Q8A67_010097 [Cirrhinus molitorella]|uniref:Uncharacterized protein n=1 Tax=Cirrhinus molitorella TaxID=172907 RepID=A0AA88TMV4_9TELE|nr:hypothetical protein Q8A67_010097 [Cirrhinus molitorella]